MTMIPARPRMEVRKMDGGEWCVDLGKKWFRVRKDGTVTAKITTWRRGELCGSVKARPATVTEAKFAKDAIAACGIV